MLSKPMQDAVNAQIGEEISSAYLYLAMSAFTESRSFKGFGRWLRLQAQEELGHATKLLDHLLTRGGRFEPRPIPAPTAEYGSVLEIFEKVLAHERHISESVYRLHEVAVASKDLPLQVFTEWFITEQVEEEANAAEIVDKIRMDGDKASSLLYLDKEYGQRGTK